MQMLSMLRLPCRPSQVFERNLKNPDFQLNFPYEPSDARRHLYLSKACELTLLIRPTSGRSCQSAYYSVAWRIRPARPDLKLMLHAADISKQAVEFAKCGAYSLAASRLTDTAIFECMTAAEMEEFFDKDGEIVKVKSSIKDVINWHVGESEVTDGLGLQDMVVANKFSLSYGYLGGGTMFAQYCAVGKSVWVSFCFWN